MTQQKPTKPQAILFDWDNTLVDSFGVIHKAFDSTLFEMGMGHCDRTEMDRLLGTASLRDNFPKIFGDRWKDAKDLYYGYFEKHHLTSFTALDGVSDMLAILHRMEIYMAVVSNKRGDYLRAEVEASGWQKYFPKVVGANDVKRDKPQPDPIYHALQGTDIIPLNGNDTVWFVGDSNVDMEAAHHADCLPIRVAPPHLKAPEDDPNFPATYLFRNTAELLNLL
ncbi:MAG: HAD family hydrolase [Alphaproteobacteria bacterium]